eukprot:90635-Pyramimonas_sp.AAC.1
MVAVAASDAALVLEVAAKIGPAKEKAKPAAAYLGTDFACGRRRAHERGAGKRETRLRKHSWRLAKAAQL